VKRFKKILIFVFFTAVIVATGFFWLNKKYASRFNLEKERFTQKIRQRIALNELSAETGPGINQPAADNNSLNEKKAVPAKHLLAMPFYSQAPNGNWNAFHEDMCEEASLLNAGLYLENKKLSLKKYDDELRALQKIEKEEIGEWKSTTISQIKKLADIYFDGRIKTKIIDNPTISQIEAEIAAGWPADEAGNPVIVPLAGRDIGNPNYRQPGPIYHMLVVKGYNEKYFITNDVGTRKGDSYVYKKNVIMDNIHDWDERDIHLGTKRVLVLIKNN